MDSAKSEGDVPGDWIFSFSYIVSIFLCISSRCAGVPLNCSIILKIAFSGNRKKSPEMVISLIMSFSTVTNDLISPPFDLWMPCFMLEMSIAPYSRACLFKYLGESKRKLIYVPNIQYIGRGLMRFAKLRLKIPDNWMTQLLHDNHDVSIRVFNCMPYNSGGRGLMRLTSSGRMESILKSIRRRKEVVRTNFTSISSRSAFGEVVIDRCAACSALKQSDCFLLSSKSKSDRCLEWDVAAESNRAAYELLDLLERYGCDVQLKRISSSRGDLGLTQRQEEILQFAYSNGFYEYPRRIRLRDLSRIFDVSPSTLSEILRAGQRRVFLEYFGTR